MRERSNFGGQLQSDGLGGTRSEEWSLFDADCRRLGAGPTSMAIHKKCLFCGEAFTGQKKNFEHIIPKWLVAEADLQSRATSVFFPSKRFAAAMSRIGLRACETCNSAASSLEAKAQAAYLKIKNGIALDDADGLAVLDWLDKLRVGLWLWLVDAGKADFLAPPKFRINQRTGYKDRIAVIARYPEAPDLRGMAIWGSGHFFVFAPSCLGFLINNIAMLSLSSDFLLARHLRPISIQRFLAVDGPEEMSAEFSRTPGRRLRLLSSPLLLGQCILPEPYFEQLELPLANPSSHAGLAVGPLMQLNTTLQETAKGDLQVPYSSGKVDALSALLELDLARANRFVMGDLLEANDERLDAETKRNVQREIAWAVALTDEYVEDRKAAYRKASGLMLEAV